MAVGQQVLSGDRDLPALDRAADAVERLERDRRALHARALRAVLDLHAAQCASGMGLGTPAQLALSLDCSELRAEQLLTEAQVLGLLPDALEALETGLLGVEQSAVFVQVTGVLGDHDRSVLWDRLLDRLRQSCLPSPARLRELLARWVRTIDPDGTADRRRAAQAAGDLSIRARQDGLSDLFATGLSPTNAAACRDRIDAASAPWGSHDDRTAGKRRLDAFVDLLLGRDRLPNDHDDHEDRAGGEGDTGGGHCRPGCGCRLQSPAPCGVQVHVHVPLGAALGGSDEPATLVGHGPLDREQLTDVLLNAPVLRAVWVDEHGVPVALGTQTHTPDRGDPESVRQALLALATQSPPEDLHPRHPHDHPAPPDTGQPTASPPQAEPGGDTARSGDGGCPDEQVLADAMLGCAPTAAGSGHAHPAGTSGGYRIPAALRRLVQVRRPLCEWPGCGHRAVRCDIDHDQAWPTGPTCPCNLGPLCRRHHRIKQTGWTKTRHTTGVRWTGPTGRHHDSPSPFTPPQPYRNPGPAQPRPPQFSPTDLEDHRWDHDQPGDAEGLELRISDHDSHCLARGAAPT